MSSTKRMTTGRETSENRDPLTGEKGAHPVGSALGAAVAGAAAGMAGGAMGGPIGAVAGAVIGGVAGGLAGKGIAESIDPTTETEHWRIHFASRPYVDAGTSFDHYEPAYRYGWEARSRYADNDFDDVESDLRSEWGMYRGESKLDWDKARPATRDAWDRIGSS